MRTRRWHVKKFQLWVIKYHDPIIKEFNSEVGNMLDQVPRCIDSSHVATDLSSVNMYWGTTTRNGMICGASEQQQERCAEKQTFTAIGDTWISINRLIGHITAIKQGNNTQIQARKPIWTKLKIFTAPGLQLKSVGMSLVFYLYSLSTYWLVSNWVMVYSHLAL